MKKIDIKDKARNYEKVTIKTIKKNPDTDVLHTIKKVKREERRAVLILASIILVCIFTCCYFVFAGMMVYDETKADDSPLKVTYIDDKDGMSDIVSFTDEDGKISVFSTEFVVSNNSGINSWYAVYLDDYTDMIEYDKCFDKLADKRKIYFSIDGSDAKDLASVYEDGRYVITQEIIPSNDDAYHILQVWHSEDINGHYHGKLDIEFIR